MLRTRTVIDLLVDSNVKYCTSIMIGDRCSVVDQGPVTGSTNWQRAYSCVISIEKGK